MRHLLILGLIFAFPGISATADEAVVIKDLLARQVSEWNRGDVEKFVSYYAEDCVFASSEVRRGRAQVLERYRRAYPNREAMGTTTFSELDVQLLGKRHAKVLGRWRLERSDSAGGSTGGWFTLVLEKRRGSWVITHDHTSVSSPAK